MFVLAQIEFEHPVARPSISVNVDKRSRNTINARPYFVNHFTKYVTHYIYANPSGQYVEYLVTTTLRVPRFH